MNNCNYCGNEEQKVDIKDIIFAEMPETAHDGVFPIIPLPIPGLPGFVF